ncbi:MAG: O-antigen ligase family protein [Dysgonamonadaceae bacterium]|nr:O-antigen ligase family protein [Dysgonamonadaceae bacterium]
MAISLNKYTAYFSVMLFLFMLSFIYFPFEHPYPNFRLQLDHRLSLLGFGLIGLVGTFSRINLKTIYYSLIASGLLVIAFIVSVKFGSHVLYGQQLSIVDVRQMYVNYHMGFDFSLNLGLIACGFLFIKNFKIEDIKRKLFLLLSFVLLLLVLLLSEGRSGFIASILITGFFIFYFLYIYCRKVFFGICLLMLIVAFYGILSHDRINLEQIKNEPRKHLFINACTLIKEKPVLGYGMQGAQYYTDSARYRRHQTDSTFINTWYQNEMVDSHNQYIQITVEYGFLGLLILLLLFTMPIFLVSKEYKLFMLCFIFLTGFQSLFDVTIFVPEFGVIFGMIMTLHLGNTKQSLE